MKHLSLSTYAVLRIFVILFGCVHATTSSATADEPRNVRKIAEELVAKWERKPEGIELKHVFSTSQFASRALICKFSPDSTFVAVRLRDGTVQVLDGTTGALVWAWPNAKAVMQTGLVHFSSDGKRIAIGVPDEGIELWDHKENRLIAKIPVKGSASSAGEDHDGESMFVAIRPKTFSPEDTQSADPKVLVSGTYDVSLTTGKTTRIPAPELNFVFFIHPIPGSAGYLALGNGLQIFSWNPSVDASKAKYVLAPSPGRNRPQANRSTNGYVPRVYMNADMAIISTNAQGTLVPMPKLLAEVNAIYTPEKPPEVTSLGYLRDTDLEMGPMPWFRMSPDGRRFFTSERLVTAFSFDLCEFGVTPSPDEMEFKANRSLDMSRDCKRVVMADDEGDTKSTIRVFELGKIPDPPAREMNEWARKAIAAKDDELIDAVLAAANKRRAPPEGWAVTLSPNLIHGSPWKQAIIGMLTNRWTPAWAIKDARAVAAWQTRKKVEPLSIAQLDAEALELNRIAEVGKKQDAQKQRQEALQKLATSILESENATPKEIKTFVNNCPTAPPGRELLIKIAGRAAVICEPDDSALVEIANGLLEYAFEKPDDPAIEPTIGFIEAVANAQAARKGADAGDAAYATFATVATNANFVKFMTGRERVNRRDDNESHQEFLENRRHRHYLVRRYLDYERLVRGFQAHLTANPTNSRVALLALELGYESNDKGLAKLAVPYLEKFPDMMKSPPGGLGNIKAYYDWARTP
jgi:hypothetical protein